MPREMLMDPQHDNESMRLLDSLYESEREAVYGALYEGVFDPFILKCIFMAGGGGSGKGFISNLMFGTTKDMATTGFGIKSLNSDDILAALAGNLPLQRARPVHRGIGGRAPLDLKTDLGTDRGQAIRNRAKELKNKRKSLFLAGRLGIIVDGTADDPGKIARMKREMENLGYDCSMVFVNTSLDVALKRNQMRARVVPEKFVRKAHAKVKAAIPQFKRIFGNYTLLSDETLRDVKAPGMVEVDNSRSVSKQEVKTKLSPLLWKAAYKLLTAPLKNPKGYEWLEAETEGMPAAMLSKVTWIGKKKGR